MEKIIRTESRSKLIRFFVLGLFVIGSFFSSVAFAAEFRRLCDLEDIRGMQCTISMTGEIKKGDARRLINILTSDPARRGEDRFLLLDSPGGDIDEAIRVGEVVKSAMLITTLVRVADYDNEEKSVKRRCVSACFLVFLAGAERKALWGELGVHRPYFDPQVYKNLSPLEIAKAQERIEEAVRRYSKSHGVSDSLIERMMAHSSRQAYWLTSREKQALEGEQSWYQEIMIATCNWDPVRERKLISSWADGARQAPEDKAWLSTAYACINRKISDSQLRLSSR